MNIKSTRGTSPGIRALVLALGLGIAATAAAHQGEPPRGYADFAAVKKSIDAMSVDAIDAADLLYRDQLKAASSGQGPVQYALPAKVSITTDSHGTWSTVEGGQLWQLKVNAPGATDLNFGFTTFDLPKGATLHIYSADGKYFQGPYTRQHQQDKQLWTPVIPGGEGVVELFVPDSAGEAKIELTQIGRGYRNLFEKGLYAAIKQGSCNNDVVCPEGNAWADQIRSVAVYGTNGSTFCTGTLVNNVEQDGRPFFITANHCNLNSGNAPSVVTYWNYESPSCGQLSGGSLSDNTNGATFRASNANNDMALIELSSVPDSSYNVYYAGWDARSSVSPSGSVGIHHPNTDEKAISFNTDPLTTGNSCIGGGGSNTHWIVDDWEDGTTEPGSSGSALFDPSTQRMIGYLSGGTASCSNTSGYDCYGKMSVGWGVGLSQWLDPNGTGTQFVDGMDSGGTPPPPPPPPPPGGGELDNGETVSNLSGGAGEWTHYTVELPSGATNLAVSMSGGSGDADLYTRDAGQPTTSSYDCRPYASGNNENCSAASPASGTYYISIRGYSAYSGVSLTVSWDDPAPPPPPPPPGGGDLGNGDTVTGLSGSTGAWDYYTIEVPAGATDLVVSMSGGSGDADLYLREGAQPTTSAYDCRPYQSGNNENCTVASPVAGTYHVGIRAYSAYSNVSLSVTWTDGGTPPPPVGGGNTINNISASRNTWKHYTLTVPAGMANLDVDISGGSGDADLYVRFGSQPTTSSYDCRPYLNGNNESCNFSNPAAGTWHISVRAYRTFSGVTLDAYYSP